MDGNGVTWVIVDFSIDHRFRRDKKSFDGNEEHRAAPKQLFGENVLHQLDGMEHINLGKTSKNNMLAKRKKEHVELEHNWKKKNSIAILENPHFASQFGCNAY